MRVRDGRTDDWDAMREVFVAAGRAAWGHILSAEVLADLAPPERWRPGASPGSDAIVAEEEGRVVGFVVLRASQDEDAEAGTGEVDACYTHPEVWGVGAGRALLAAAAARLAARGFREATLWTEERNRRPLRFYAASGWRLDGARRERSFRGTDLLELRHRIVLEPPQA
jgi:GNAT superfamily N-acetyltransferase